MNQLTVLQRSQQLALRAAVIEKLIPLWQALDPARLNDTLPTWLAATVPVVADGRKASAYVAGLYVQAMRDAAGIKGRAPVEMAAAINVEQAATALTVTSVVQIRKAIAAGKPLEQAMRSGLVASSGAATRLALQGGRETVVNTVRADHRAVGWNRSTSSSPCAFCALLASRGAVYRDAGTAEFRAHDHCSCVAEPVYSPGAAVPTGRAAEWHRLYEDHAAGGRDQLNKFRRAYEARL